MKKYGMPRWQRSTCEGTKQGSYEYLLNTDDPNFGGHGFNDDKIVHFTNYDGMLARDNKGWLKLYLPARTACVLVRVE